ncbi:Glutathione synthase, substrate-binding, eukaryotic domain-containing protein, partial [Rozella allomycis CSF55]
GISTIFFDFVYCRRQNKKSIYLDDFEIGSVCLSRNSKLYLKSWYLIIDLYCYPSDISILLPLRSGISYKGAVDMELSLEFVQDTIDWCLRNGLCLRATTNFAQAVHAPISVFPSTIHKDMYQKSIELQYLIHKLIDKMSTDKEFIFSIFEPISKVDAFVNRLFQIYKKYPDGNNPITFAVIRTDYMEHVSDSGRVELKQVEYNTIAASFACLSGLVTKLHKFIQKRYDFESKFTGCLPDNNSLIGIADGIATAFKAYGNEKHRANVLMVVQPFERNVFDQRFIENRLFEKRTLTEVDEHGSISSNGSLLINETEISIVYFRAGYSPNDFPTDKEWRAREMIEKSTAISCPNIAYTLIGFKKIQEILCQENTAGLPLKRYLQPNEAKFIRSSFMKFHSFDTKEELISIVSKNPESLVLKPQREGGGNNIYGKDILPFLNSLNDDSFSSYVLMELINTKPFLNYIIKDGKVMKANLISELGIYGVFIKNSNQILENKVIGHLLRSKSQGVNEGGVAAGYGVIDSFERGRVRTKTVKRASRVLIEKYYPRLTLDFQTNKRICDEVAVISTKRLRNKIAGFTTHLMKRIQKGPVRGISFKLQEEEREKKDNYVPEISALDTSSIQIDSTTEELLKSMGIENLTGVSVVQEEIVDERKARRVGK